MHIRSSMVGKCQGHTSALGVLKKLKLHLDFKPFSDFTEPSFAILSDLIRLFDRNYGVIEVHYFVLHVHHESLCLH